MRGALLCLWGCACAAPTHPLAVAAQPLVGGTADDSGQYAAVHYLRSVWNNMTPTHCTATLIAPRVLLTAAHCVDPRKAGSTAVELYALNASPAPADTAPDWVRLGAPRFHPSYRPADFRDPFDVALVLLPQASSAPPIPFDRLPLDGGYVGRPLTVVGYGITSPSVIDPGTRRAAELTFRGLSSTHVLLGDQQGKGICNGDSGGPSLHRFADGVVRVVGVHSYTEPFAGCLDGADVRVDRFTDFIEQYLVDNAAFGCTEDGRCASGCAPADPDCTPPFAACAADGECGTGHCADDAERVERYCVASCPCDAGVCSAGLCLKAPPAKDAGSAPDGGPGDPAGRSGCAAAPGLSLPLLLLLVWRRARAARHEARRLGTKVISYRS